VREIVDVNRETSWAEEEIPLSQHSIYRKVRAIMTGLSVGSVLEVGCASGRFLEFLRGAGWDVQGLDLQPQSRPYIVTGDASKPWPLPRRYDVVIATEVIEHIVDTDGFLSECAAHLKPGGTLILSTPNLLFGVNRLRMLFGMRPHFSYAEWHVRMFVWSDLRSRIEKLFTIRRLRGSHVLVGVHRSELFRIFSWLGDLFPTLAAHFIVVATPRPVGQ
jgi:2-polyprenyl-3-methyl-5-hydroxy-6-metoxy-1,4-benzoquinol methylase